jgi:hypothetical protein
MKKISFVLVSLLFAAFVVVSGCQKNSPSSPGATNTPTANATETAAALLTAGPSAQATATAQAQLTADAQASATALSQQETATMAVQETETATAGAAATATALAGQVGTVSGTLTLPSAKNGESWGVAIVHNILDVTSQTGPINSTSGVLGMATSIPYSMTATAGTYYVLAYTMPSGSNGGPVLGDFVGIYGTVYPAIPSSANVTVTKNNTTTANITMGTISNSVSGTVTLPASISSMCGYLVVIPVNQPSFVNGTDLNNFGDGSVGGYGGAISSGNQIAYTIPIIFPGSFYMEAVVDVDNSSTISTGDYVGSTPITLNPANNQTKNFTIGTQP